MRSRSRAESLAQSLALSPGATRSPIPPGPLRITESASGRDGLGPLMPPRHAWHCFSSSAISSSRSLMTAFSFACTGSPVWVLPSSTATPVILWVIFDTGPCEGFFVGAPAQAAAVRKGNTMAAASIRRLRPMRPPPIRLDRTDTLVGLSGPTPRHSVGLKPDLLPVGLKPDLLPVGLKPDLLPVGLKPDLLPVGLKPDLLPVGLKPDLLPVGLKPDLLPVGLKPDLLDEDSRGLGLLAGFQGRTDPPERVADLLLRGLEGLDLAPQGGGQEVLLRAAVIRFDRIIVEPALEQPDHLELGDQPVELALPR